MARAQESINKLPPELKAVSDGYLKKNYTPEGALKMTQIQERINLKEAADGFEKK